MNGTNAVPTPANVQPQPHAIPPNATPGVMPVAAISANGGGSSVSAGTPDYSAQWIEYYRSIGKNKEADMVEQQVKARVSMKHFLNMFTVVLDSEYEGTLYKIQDTTFK